MNSTMHRTREDMAALLNRANPKGRLRGSVRLLIAAVIVAGLLAGVLAALQSKSNSAAPAFITEPVQRGDLHVQVSATGKLQPTNTVEVGSELSGLVESVLVDENDSVKKGQVLARLDTSKLQDEITKTQATLASAQAKLAEADATVKESTANLQRLRQVWSLSGGKVPSQAEMETAEATLARAQGEKASASAAVAEQKAVLSTDRTNLAKASIRSPIDGVVLTRAVEPGQTVAASLQAPTLFTIAEDLREMELKVDVDEADVGRVQAGQQSTFTVDAYPNRTYTANVTRVAYGSTTTADVVSYATELKVRNDDLSLRPGMTASAEINAATVTHALLVPNAALRFTPADDDAPNTNRGLLGRLMPRGRRGAASRADGSPKGAPQQVWIVRDGAAVPVPVTVGQTDGRYTEVAGGDLQEGAQVITDMSGAQA